jgi:hypothetical protein
MATSYPMIDRRFDRSFSLIKACDDVRVYISRSPADACDEFVDAQLALYIGTSNSYSLKGLNQLAARSLTYRPKARSYSLQFYTSAFTRAPITKCMAAIVVGMHVISDAENDSLSLAWQKISLVNTYGSISPLACLLSLST